MAVTLERIIFDLFAEFLTNAFVIFRPLATARAVTARHGKTVFDDLDYFFVFVKFDLHILPVHFFDMINVIERFKCLYNFFVSFILFEFNTAD